MNVEWDEGKNLENKRKHDIDFDTAALVFDDPFAVTVRADSDEADEERWITIGSAGGGSLFFVVHTWRDDSTVRLISVRTASKQERRSYEEANKAAAARHRGFAGKKGRGY